MITVEEIEPKLKALEAKLLVNEFQAANLANVTVYVAGSSFKYYPASSWARVTVVNTEMAELTRVEALERIKNAFNERYFS
jgi:hypothetical protein